MSDLNPYEESLAVDLAKTEAAIKAMSEQLEAARHDADEAEAYAWQLEQRLSKAMEALRIISKFIAITDNHRNIYNIFKMTDLAHTTLTELEGKE